MWKKSFGSVQRMKALDHSQTPRSPPVRLCCQGSSKRGCSSGVEIRHNGKAAHRPSNSPFASEHLLTKPLEILAGL